MEAVRLILHIDDSADDAALVELALRSLPVAADVRLVQGEEALRSALLERLPDVVICDYEMPGLSPSRALAIVREHSPAIPFILASHHVGSDPSLRVHGATAHVSKGDLARLVSLVTLALS